ncbi:MAG: rod shape-determining protein MreD [Pseudomonadota bacterium]
MEQTVHRGGLIILFSFAIAGILAIIPMPDQLAIMRPQWVSLVLIFWCMMLPHRIGVFIGWTVGLFLDILYGTLLGQYALTLSVVAFLSYKFQTRLRLYPVLQQAMIILLLIALQQMMVLWIKGISGDVPKNVTYWLPSLTSTLVWPVVVVVLHKVRQWFGIV